MFLRVGFGLVFYVAALALPRSRCFRSPCRCVAFGVGFGRPAWRFFRLSLMFVRAWCWLTSEAPHLGAARMPKGGGVGSDPPPKTTGRTANFSGWYTRGAI